MAIPLVEFEVEFPEIVRTTNPATVRSWKLRGVPDRVANDARALQSPVASVDATAESVAKPVAKENATEVATAVVAGRLSVVIPSAEMGHPEFDILSDGWARGFACDVLLPWNRVTRTCHAIRRIAESKGGDTSLVKAMVRYWEEGKGESAESRVACLKKLAEYEPGDKWLSALLKEEEKAAKGQEVSK